METALIDTRKYKNRPYTEEFKSALLAKFYAYIENNEFPIIEEFCTLNNIHKQRLYGWRDIELRDYENSDDNLIIDSWRDSLKKATQKQETFLVKNGIRNKINVGMAMFLLKQPWHGYRDDYNQPQTSKDSITIQLDGKPATDLMDSLRNRLQGNKTKNLDKRKELRTSKK